jgi:hypothetical protein
MKGTASVLSCLVLIAWLRTPTPGRQLWFLCLSSRWVQKDNTFEATQARRPTSRSMFRSQAAKGVARAKSDAEWLGG